MWTHVQTVIMEHIKIILVNQHVYFVMLELIFQTMVMLIPLVIHVLLDLLHLKHQEDIFHVLYAQLEHIVIQMLQND